MTFLGEVAEALGGPLLVDSAAVRVHLRVGAGLLGRRAHVVRGPGCCRLARCRGTRRARTLLGKKGTGLILLGL
eukprot:4201510-Alexandrium_andersonii.AAC.1